ncbi:similar to Saccharomyces cerevisiae YNL274C GOR1 Glyoxylate reductase [Maudiozyma barnettii]|uniref:Similar to Saccharomyces cerevisiae YNL274C GOR1 Glyoxylate reductase n=1 Tax=Maudiozyma barnettii TaxID=61262 RepID=A0A8H2VE89_9SACH|nr:glyoxylate reductase [Kazachstania barnettii]CAB4253947.1 similar to Saccharomyces cerevisiae YNL274C GOR1 Glyoxylate reductase [Kazachstania barnettii]CAD1781697.1 similar to Saccharomyces cerevisiae YNL274C GOR1 Glyoxylate reductase [Kazachstania barnettii]
MSEKPVLLCLGGVSFPDGDFSELSKVAQVITLDPATTREQFIKRLGDSNDILSHTKVITRTFSSIKNTGRFDEEIAKALPDSVVAICHNGAGYDQIDVEYFSKRHIQISNTPDVVSNATADTHVFLLLGALRYFSYGVRELLNEGNSKVAANNTPFGNDPEGKTVGVLGLGGIGHQIVKRLKPFGFAKFIYHNRHRLSPELENGCEYVSFDELIANSDIISINIPLNEHTRHTINAEAIAKMKDRVVIVNTARGAVMDEQALVEALKSGKVKSAGLDVFEFEPEVTKELLEMKQVVCTPHLGTQCIETRQKMEELVYTNALQAVTQGKVKTIVPEISHEEWFIKL